MAIGKKEIFRPSTTLSGSLKEQFFLRMTAAELAWRLHARST
jgi:hypothetical protein